jgi:hypothetical protein
VHEKHEPRIVVSPELCRIVDAALRSLAMERRTITYAAMARRLEIAPPHQLRKLIVALEELASEHHRTGKPVLSALVVSRVREGLPAPGFFAHLHRIGAYDGEERGPAARAWHAEELARVFGEPE